MPDVLEVGGESAAAQVGPRLWRKHLLRWGEWVHPSNPDRKLQITPEFASKLKANFDAAVLDSVPVPGKHTDDWKANHGATLGLEIHPEKGVYALLSVDAEADAAIAEGKLKGVSAGLYENYLNKESGQHVGPVLRHVSLTNVPYIKHLEGFEKVADLDEDEQLVMLSEVETPRKETAVTREEALAFLKGEGIDVEALQSQDAVLKSLREAIKTSGVELSEDATPEQAAAALASLKRKADESTELSERVAGLEKAARRTAAEALVTKHAAKIDPAERDKFLDFAEKDPEMFELAMSGRKADPVRGRELGSSHSDADPSSKPVDFSEPSTKQEDIEAEVERYAKLGKESGLRTRTKVTA